MLADVVADPSIADAKRITARDADLAALRLQFKAVGLRLRGELSASDVAARRVEAIPMRNNLTRTSEAHPEPVWTRATVLPAQPDGRGDADEDRRGGAGARGSEGGGRRCEGPGRGPHEPRRNPSDDAEARAGRGASGCRSLRRRPRDGPDECYRDVESRY